MIAYQLFKLQSYTSSTAAAFFVKYSSIVIFPYSSSVIPAWFISIFWKTEQMKNVRIFGIANYSLARPSR